MARNPDHALSGGSTTGGWYPTGFKFRRLAERVAISAAASGSLTQPLPANAMVVASGMANATAFTHVTATRLGLGTASQPTKFGISSATTTINTKSGPFRCESPGVLFSNQSASAAITNTVAETAFSFTGMTIPSIPANALRPGDIVRIRFQGIATATNGTDTLAVKAYLGSVAVSTLAAVDVANNNTFQGSVDVFVRAIGASGTLTAMSIQPVIGAGQQDGTSAVTYRSEFLASTAIDTSAAIAPTIKGTWSVANAGNSCRLDILSIEIVRPSESFSSAQQTVVVASVNDAGIPTGTTTGTVDCYLWFYMMDDLPSVS